METFPTINKFPQDNLLVGIVPLNIAFSHIELFIKSIFDIKQKAFILANKHLADNSWYSNILVVAGLPSVCKGCMTKV